MDEMDATPVLSCPIDVYGHRGARGDVAENTIEGFVFAADAGVAGVELDVLLTADDHAVVWHDPVIGDDKCLDDSGSLVGRRVADCSLAQVQSLDVGSLPQPAFPDQRLVPGARIQTLERVLTQLRQAAPDIRVLVEIKSDPLAAAAVDERRRLVGAVLHDVRAAQAEQQVVMHSFDWNVNPLVEAAAPELPRSVLAIVGETFVPESPWLLPGVYAATGGDLIAAAVAAHASVVSPFHGLAHRRGAFVEGLAGGDPSRITAREVVDADFCRRAHDAGLAVVPWTVDDPDTLRGLARAGVDGVVCDYQARALQVLRDL